MFWRLGESIGFFNNLFGFIKLTITMVREREVTVSSQNNGLENGSIYDS